MKALVTGATGFVGGYLVEHLLSQGYEVWGTTRQSYSNCFLGSKFKLVELDLQNESSLIAFLNTIEPSEIYHLAGQSNVKQSWDNKIETYNSNIIATVCLLEAILKSKIRNTAKILTVGSSEEYGRVDYGLMPIKEQTTLNPQSPYGVSKAAISFFAKQYYEAYGMKLIHVRPFNHIGPGQKLGFVVRDFAQQIVDIEQGKKENILMVGNLDSIRDFTDVRDIVNAYTLLMQKTTLYGEVYNVCSSAATSIGSILDNLISLSRSSIAVSYDQKRMRPSDVPLYLGDNDKIKKNTGWSPVISIQHTLIDILNSLRK